LFVAAELYVSSSWDRLEELALAPHDAVVALSLFLIDPAGLLALQVAAAAVAFIVVGSRSRAPLSRFLALTAGTGASLIVFGSLTGAGDLRGPLGWVSALAAVIAGLVTRSLAEIAYARLSGERPARRDLERGVALAQAGERRRRGSRAPPHRQGGRLAAADPVSLRRACTAGVFEGAPAARPPEAPLRLYADGASCVRS
jgi:hypothetical protein